MEVRDAQWGATPLHWAALGNREAMVVLLLARGGAVDARNGGGRTPLHNAAYVGSSGAVGRLLEAGANAGLQDAEGLTPLKYARERGHTAAAALLEEAEAELRRVPEKLPELITAGRYAEARVLAKRWLDAGRPGMVPGRAQATDQLIFDVSFKVWSQTFILDTRSFPPDIQANYREEGGWDLPVPVDTPYFHHKILLANVASCNERTDSAANRWLRLEPSDADRPVVAKIFTKAIPSFIDMAALEGPYSVPAEYRKYLEPSEEVNSQSSLARSIAGPLKAATTRQTVLNVWRWISDNMHYGGIQGSGDDSESSLRTRWAVCFGYATSACALLRANGIAARVVRGVGHSWPQVWIPGAGWMDMQDNVHPVGRTDWNVWAYIAEPLDWSTHSPLLDWKLCNLRYAAQFSDFFHWGPQRFLGGARLLQQSLEDIDLDKAIGGSGIANALAGQSAWLQDLPVWRETQGFGQLGHGCSVDRHPLRIAGVPFSHGLGTHAFSSISYDLSASYQRFEALVGVDDETDGGSVQFRAYVDDKLLFDSGVIRRGEVAKRVSIPLERGVCLRLESTDGGDGNTCDHADWADARLVGTEAGFRYVPLELLRKGAKE